MVSGPRHGGSSPVLNRGDAFAVVIRRWDEATSFSGGGNERTCAAARILDCPKKNYQKRENARTSASDLL
jgi:hypothetical protein